MTGEDTYLLATSIKSSSFWWGDRFILFSCGKVLYCCSIKPSRANYSARSSVFIFSHQVRDHLMISKSGNSTVGEAETYIRAL